MAGFGRTGQWLALDAFDVRPDLITFAKGVNSGYVPVGGVIISDPIASAFDDRVFPGGLTYSGHPLAAASIVAALKAMAEEDVVGNAARIGAEVLGPGLRELAAKHELVGEVRGVGVFWAIELVANRTTKAPLVTSAMAQLKRDLLDRGLLPFIVDNRIHVVPPANIDVSDARHGLAVIDEALTALRPLTAPALVSGWAHSAAVRTGARSSICRSQVSATVKPLGKGSVGSSPNW